VIKQRCAPAVLHLLFDRREIGVVLHVIFADIENREPSLFQRARH
jgi:hypothetical protein